MAKKDFSADALDAFELERPKKPKAEPTAEPQPEPAQPQPVQPAPIQSAPAAAAPDPAPPQPAPAPRPVSVPPPQQEELIRRTYYISPAQHKALKIRAATSDNPEEKDISKIVRAAIDQYLAK